MRSRAVSIERTTAILWGADAAGSLVYVGQHEATAPPPNSHHHPTAIHTARLIGIGVCPYK